RGEGLPEGGEVLGRGRREGRLRLGGGGGPGLGRNGGRQKFFLQFGARAEGLAAQPVILIPGFLGGGFGIQEIGLGHVAGGLGFATLGEQLRSRRLGSQKRTGGEQTEN